MEGISNASWYPAVQSLMCKQDHIGFNMAIRVTFLVASAMAMLRSLPALAATDLNSLRIYFTKIFWYYYMTQEKRKEHNHWKRMETACREIL